MANNYPPRQTPEAPTPCCAPDDPAAVLTERNRFFTGKYMTARDFHDEQSYFLAHHRLHQRILHGWGIVCGLEVQCHPDSHCAQRGWVVVTPGIAIDCYGREIVLHEKTPVKLNGLSHDDVPCGEEDSCHPPPQGCEFLLGIRYGEVCIEPVPVLYDEENCGKRMTHNRIQERPCFRYRAYDPNDEGCWSPAEPPWCTYLPLPATDAGKASDCLSPGNDFSKPLCPCGEHGFVPLGRFAYKVEDKDKVDITLKDFSGRRYLFGPLHPYTLTHICYVNWNHGDCTPLVDLKKDYKEGREADERAGKGDHYHHRHEKHHEYLRLTIQFDRPLCGTLPPSDAPHGMGFYRQILSVRYDSVKDGLVPLPEPGIAHLSHCRTKLYYDVLLRCLDHMRDKAKDPIIHVTLNCDFLPDEQGRAVDGNHLRGALKHKHKGRTGDGIEGGVFESWFQLDW